MTVWNYINDERLRRIVDALSPFFTGPHQLSLVQLADIIAEIGYNEAVLDLENLETFRAQIQSPAGASVVGSTSGDVQTDLDNIDGRLDIIETGTVHADLNNIAGNGSDVTAALQSMLNSAAGKTVILGVNKTYGITSINIPADTTIVSNGSKFTKLTASSTPAIKILGSFETDLLWLESVGGASDAGILVEGSNVAIGKIVADFAAADSGSAGGVHAVSFYNGVAGQITNIQVGEVQVDDHAYPLKTQNVSGIEIGKLTFTNYRRGYDCQDTKNGTFFGGTIKGLSPSSTGAVNDVGLLVTSTVSDGSSNLRFERVMVENAGSHSFSIAGTHRVRNVHFNRCKSTGSGAKGATAAGSSAFRVVGNAGTSVYHEDIYVDDLLIDDCSLLGAGTTADSAVQMGLVRNAEVSFRVRKNVGAHSCKYGLTVYSCENVHIHPEVLDAKEGAARFVAEAGAPTTMTDVIVHGGVLDVDSTTANVASFACGSNTFNNVSISEGTLLTGGVSGTVHTAPAGGAYTNCSVDIKRIRAQTTSGNPPTVNSNDILVRMIGPLYGTSHTQGSDGSQVTDTATGAFKIRKAGTWTTL